MPDDLLSGFPRVSLQHEPTPIERLPRLSDELGIDLWIKRDDLTAISMGGNKIRQLEFYLGDAQAKGATTILITGAVQSNFARTAATTAAMLGMKAILQAEDRVPGRSSLYRMNGNMLLARLAGATQTAFPEGENEAAADASLAAQAAALEGEVPYIIHLGLGPPPLGALGYIRGAREALNQLPDFDISVVPSGSGSTHVGWQMGLALAGHSGVVQGICARRDATAQTARIATVGDKLADLLAIANPVARKAIQLSDTALAPGYGLVSDKIRAAIGRMAQTEGILLDPVYSGKTFAGLLDLVATGHIGTGKRVLLLHTGGQAALFAYQPELDP